MASAVLPFVKAKDCNGKIVLLLIQMGRNRNWFHGVSFLSTCCFRRIDDTADRIRAKTVLHQIMFCPPDKGGRISISTNISSGSIKVRI